MVPKYVSEQIKTKHLFGYQTEYINKSGLVYSFTFLQIKEINILSFVVKGWLYIP